MGNNLLIKMSYFNKGEKKKGGNDRKAKIQKEKEQINTEYSEKSLEEVIGSYKERSETLLEEFKEKLANIQLQKNNPKLIEALIITYNNKKYTIAEVASVNFKGANLIQVAPFDPKMKEAINKGIETSKLDVQIKSEDDSLILTLGNIPNDMKKEFQLNLKRLYDSKKEMLKKIRQEGMSEAKKLEKILGKDEAKQIEKSVTDTVEK